MSLIALIIALLVGGGFLYLFFTDSLRGPAGQSGISAPGYYCSSRAEVQAAINAIGAGKGTIIIIADFPVDVQINVDQGGDLIIEGYGTPTLTPAEKQLFENLARESSYNPRKQSRRN